MIINVRKSKRRNRKRASSWKKPSRIFWSPSLSFNNVFFLLVDRMADAFAVENLCLVQFNNMGSFVFPGDLARVLLPPPPPPPPPQRAEQPGTHQQPQFANPSPTPRSRSHRLFCDGTFRSPKARRRFSSTVVQLAAGMRSWQ